MKRLVVPELLDSDAGSADEVAGSLADLRFFNRCFGGISTGYALLRRVSHVTGLTCLRILDVASGSGDVAPAAAGRLSREGIHLEVTFLDRAPAHLPANARCVVGDALALPFRDRSFDLVTCGLFAHHLEATRLIRFAQEGMRVASTALLINDLIRHPVHLALVYAGMPLYRSRLTRHDAPASVRAAYTTGEMAGLLKEAGCRRVEISRHYLFRMGVIAWK